jgi:hypothetical protein
MTSQPQHSLKEHDLNKPLNEARHDPTAAVKDT